MSKYVQHLLARRDRLSQEEQDIVQEILGDSINPQRTAYLLRRMEGLIAEHIEAGRHLDVWLERSKKTWWERLTQT